MVVAAAVGVGGGCGHRGDDSCDNEELEAILYPIFVLYNIESEKNYL